MYFGLYSCPDWQGSKKSDKRPCIVRREGVDKAWVIPCTTKYHDADEGVYISQLKKPSFAVMTEGCVVNLSDIEVLDEVPPAVEDEVFYWELTHNVRMLTEEEHAHALQLCF